MDPHFDPTTHTYTMDGRRVPGITEILRAAGLLEGVEATVARWGAGATERGSRVHAAIHAEIDGALDEEHPDTLAWKAAAPNEWGMVLAARKARKELELRPVAAEALVAHGNYGYATHVDLIAGRANRLVVLNWKTSQTAYPWEAVQAAGEELAVDAGFDWSGIADIPHSFANVRMAIHLAADGTYRVNEWKDRTDYDVFRAALKVWGWRQKNERSKP